MANRKTASGTATTTAPAIIRCSCSTNLAVWRPASGQRSRRRRVASGAEAGRGALSRQGLAHLFSRRRRLCYPLFTPVRLKNRFFRDHPSVTMLPDFGIFQSIRDIALRYGNSDHSSTYQRYFWAISGDLASITWGQARPPAAHASARLSHRRVPCKAR